MRVLQVMAGAGQGGAETFFVDLVAALHRGGLDERVVIRRNGERAALLSQFGLDPVQMSFRRWFDLTTRPALASEVKSFRPDIVQTWMNRATSAMPRGPFLHIGWLGGYYDLKHFKRCHHLVGVTPGIVQHLVANGWPPERAHYLPTLAADEPQAPVPRATFDTPEGVPLIVALGRLHVKKAFDILLEAVARTPDAHLWIAGSGPLEQKLVRQRDSLGLAPRVRFLGWRSDRAALLAAADMCVMPSRYEPFGTVMLEAWANRTPLIASAAAGPRGLVRDGENGLLVPIDDVEALAAAIRRLIADPGLARGMAERARRQYEAEYTEAAVVERYMAFYRSVLEMPRAAAGA